LRKFVTPNATRFTRLMSLVGFGRVARARHTAEPSAISGTFGSKARDYFPQQAASLSRPES